MENPFIPSRSKVCRLADTALIFALALAGLVAAVAVVVKQLGQYA